MARSAPAFSSFTAGEISPRLEGRINIEKYTEGLSDLTNMVVLFALVRTYEEFHKLMHN